MTTIKIVNTETGEENERAMNADELAQFAKDNAELQARTTAQIKAEATKSAALAKLAALGLTADDLTALGL